MSWKYKDKKCKCRANLKGIEPVNPLLHLDPDDRSIADCPNPECSETLIIVEGKLDPIPESEPEPEAEVAPEPEPVVEPTPEPEPEPAPEPEE